LGLNRVRSFLRRHRRIALDTSIFIYQLQPHPRYVAFTNAIFEWLARPGSRAVTSTITMTELLVHPYRNDNEQLTDEFYGLLSVYPNLEWIAPSLEIADLAARIRAAHRLRTPDALQAATALHAHATGLVTNDPIFERLQNLETLVLDRIL
jgi:predicted nucleic acid-binding protein